MRPPRLLVAATMVVLAGRGAAAQTRAPGAAASSSPHAAPAPPGAPSLADTLSGQAAADYASARMLFGVNDHAGALIKFTAAYEGSHDARLLFDMAICESKLHHYARALGRMRAYLKDGGARLPEGDRADAEAAIRAFEPLTSTVTFRVPEPGATVTMDGEALGQSPLPPLAVDIGAHKIRVSRPDFEDFTTELTVPGGSAVTVEVRLTPVVHEGRVTVRAAAGDAIAIDGAPVGAGEWTGVLRSGGHTLRVTAPGKLSYQSEIVVQDGQTRDVGITLDPEPSRALLPAWAWIAGGVVVAGGLGVGGYFLFKPSPRYEGATGNLGPGIVQASAPVRF